MVRATLLCLLLATAAAAQDRAEPLERAWEAWHENRLRDALARVEPLLAASPDHAETIALRGRIRFDLGQYDGAVADLDRAAELEPEEWRDLARSVACRVAFFRADDAKVRELLPTFERGEVTRALPYLIEPPRLERYQQRKGRYVIYADEALRAHKGEVYAARVMELIYEAYSKVFPFPVDARLISRVYVFGDHQEYLRFSREAFEDDASDAAGYFSLTTRVLVVDADPQGAPANEHGFSADAVDTLFHEGFHQFVSLHVPQGLPLWFDEGLAEYFGPSTPRGARQLNVGVVLKKDPGVETRYERIIAGLRDREVWPLARFLRQREEEFSSDRRSSLNYAQSWSLMHFLIHGMGAKGKRLIKDFFKVLRDGGTEEEAFAATFGKADLDALDAAWRKYVLGL